MQSSQFISEKIDISQYPTFDPNDTGKETVVFGDMHGNVLLFLWRLIRHKRVFLGSDAYHEIASLYHRIHLAAQYIRICNEIAEIEVDQEEKMKEHSALQATEPADKPGLEEADYLQKCNEYIQDVIRVYAELSKKNPLTLDMSEEAQMTSQQFKTLIESMVVLPGGSVILLGDDLHDRGANDEWMFEFIAKLCREGLSLFILQSNHGLLSHSLFESENAWPKDDKGIASHNLSAYNMVTLIEAGHASKEHIASLRENYYLPRLRIVLYTLDFSDPASPCITLCTHAPVGLNTLTSLACSLGVLYQENTIFALAHTIDHINAKYRDEVILKKKIFSSFHDEGESQHTNNASLHAPLTRTLFNREPYETRDRMPEKLNGFRINYTHGHQSFTGIAEKYAHYIFSLDHGTGNGPGRYIGVCPFYRTTGRPYLTTEETLAAKETAPPPPSGTQQNFLSILNSEHASPNPSEHPLLAEGWTLFSPTKTPSTPHYQPIAAEMSGMTRKRKQVPEHENPLAEPPVNSTTMKPRS